MRVLAEKTASSFLFFLVLLLTLGLSSCKKKERAKPMSANISSYIYAHTSGLISKADPIKVRFNSVVSGNDASSILSFQPSINGNASWEDEYTLLFQPDDLLASGSAYIGKVNLKKLFTGLPQDAQSFEFDFRTKDQYFQVQFEGVQAPNPNELSKQELQGKILTADLAEEQAVEKLLSAKQNRENLNINWIHNTLQNEHRFIVENIQRSPKAQKVALKWNGNALDVDLSGEKEFEIPALGDFKITNVKVVQDQNQYISLFFSDPLQESQNVEGLVSISDYNGTMRYLIEGQELSVFPNQRLVGNHKIVVNQGLKNLAGNRMKNSGEWLIEFQDVKPQVRLAGQGVIMPTSKGLIFPFEAVSLNAVEVEIFKIYNNNILQFLQNHQISENGYNLQTVGRIIMQKKVDLNSLNPDASSATWTRYALDLEPLITQDPEAIYQVRIGFRPSYSTYFCSNAAASEDEGLNLQTTDLDENDEITSIMESWYGIDGWYEGYNWQHRENPCFPGYYNSDNFVRRNVVASNLGLIAKGGEENEYFVSVTDLRSTEAISGATVEFYDYQQQLLSSTTTDGQGLATAKLERQPFVLVAKQGNQKGYLRLATGNSLSLSRFDVGGAISQKGLKGYLYAERGVWRPGDSIYLNFVLEDKKGKLPPNYPINFELYDPRGQLQKRTTVSNPKGNLYPLYFNTNADAPTGSWVAKVTAGGAQFDKVIRVETVKPNRLKIDLDFGSETLSKNQEPYHAKLQVNWLHGAPARDLKTKVEVALSTTPTKFDAFGNYVFDDPARSFNTAPKILFEETVDNQGYASFSTSLLNNQNAPGRLNANFKTRAFEKSGDFSTDNFTMTYDPYLSYAGINIPEDSYGQKRIKMGIESPLSFVAVDQNGKAQANKKLKVGLYRVDWRWWWDNGRDNVSRYNTSTHFDAQQKADLTTNSKGEVSWNVKVEDWGRYLVRICDTESGHCSGDYFYAGSPRYGEDRQFREAAAMMAFSSDKDVYQVGEKVELNIPTGQVGKALVTIENGTQVLESFWFDSKEGENKFSFETTEAMTPTAYAHVTLIQPHAKVENDLPIRLYGVIPIKVEDESTKLHPQLKMPDELQPEQTVTVEVSEKEGKAMTYTVALVDEGLLSLTRFKTPNPWDAFYAREALGVRTWDVYDHVLGAYGGELERLLNIGGGAELKKTDADSKANRFKPVVMHLGPFELKAKKKAKHEIKIPNYVGAVRTMIVASNEGAYGSVDKTTEVKNPLMILATLPRVLSPGESLKLPVNVFAMDDKVKQVNVKIEETSGLAQLVSSSNQSINFNAPGDQLVNFDIKLGERVGVARFKISATGGGENASQNIEIQVRNPNPIATNVHAKVIESGDSWTKSFDPVGMFGTNEGILELSNLPPLNLGERLDYLIRYPYGCLEQTLSGGFPQLYVDRLLELNDAQKEKIPENIKATIERLKQFQTDQGGFGYWPGNSTPNHWSTNYAGHFLLEAKALGYDIPPGMIEKWVKFQKKTAKMWDPKLGEYGYYSARSYELNQAYRLYTLAVAQKPDLGAMNRLRELKGLSKQAQWRLAAAYARAGKTEVAKDLIQGSTPEFEDYQELSYTFGSGTRDRAMALETLLALGDKETAANVVKYLSEQLSSRRWHSTQTLSYSLMAIGKYVGETGASKQFSFTYSLGGKDINAGSNSPIFQVDIPLDTEGTRKIELKNTSEGPLFARLILKGQPIAGAETASSSDLQISVEYKDMKGNAISPASISQGTDFIAEVKVVHPGSRPMPYREMALSQIFPSGWEIMNTRMDKVQQFKQVSKYDYQDIRDDRVNTFFSVRERESKVYRVQLNAAYQGRFYLPAVNCEAMYDESINAREAGQWVEVSAPTEI